MSLNSQLLGCKFVVSTVAISFSPLAQIMEFVNLGDLTAYIKKNPPAPFRWRLKAAFDVARALSYLHSLPAPILHLDVKSPNILLHQTNAYSNITAKLADFGLSRSLHLSLALQTAAIDNCIWTAPEVLSRQFVTLKADVYSFGMILWELFHWDFPFSSWKWMAKLEAAIISGERPVISDQVTRDHPTIAQLMKECWASIPSDRPDFASSIISTLSSSFPTVPCSVDIPF